MEAPRGWMCSAKEALGEFGFKNALRVLHTLRSAQKGISIGPSTDPLPLAAPADAATLSGPTKLFAEHLKKILCANPASGKTPAARPVPAVVAAALHASAEYRHKVGKDADMAEKWKTKAGESFRTQDFEHSIWCCSNGLRFAPRAEAAPLYLLRGESLLKLLERLSTANCAGGWVQQSSQGGRKIALQAVHDAKESLLGTAGNAAKAKQPPAARRWHWQPQK